MTRDNTTPTAEAVAKSPNALNDKELAKETKYSNDMTSRPTDPPSVAA
jgi:hypothetical protein